MRRLYFTVCLIIGLFNINTSVHAQAKAMVKDQLKTADAAALDGYVGGRFDLSYHNRIMAQDNDRLVHPFTAHNEHWCWQSEFWGKWFTSAVLAYHYKPTPELYKLLEKTVYDLIKTQTPDGYIGNYAPESRLKHWDIWGRKYVMLGLIAFYDISNDKNSLTAASKEADFLMNELKEKNANIVELGSHRGMAASSVLEPICLLYSRTGNKKYLDFAEEIVRQWETPKGPKLISKANIPVGQRFPKPNEEEWYTWAQGQKAYEMMSCYEGLLELYRLTGKEIYKKAVEQTWQSIMDSEINIAGSGSAMEAWFNGKILQAIPLEHYQETCVTATWVKLNQQLLRLTGDVKYAEAIEQTFYNALLGSMFPDGSDWAKYTPLSGQRVIGTEQCEMGLHCCSASGPRGLFTIPLTSIMESNSGINFNFYIPGNYTVKSPKGNLISVRQTTDYPVSGKIEIELSPKKNEAMAVELRIPSWSKKSEVLVNGQSVDDVVAGNYLKINRVWKKGDKITLNFDMRAKLQSIGEKPKYVAITRGPIVLTRDERLSGPALDAIITPVKNEEGYIDLTAKNSDNPEIWMTFSAKFEPETYTQYLKLIDVELCDYASAGNSSKAFPLFRVWMPQLYNPRD